MKINSNKNVIKIGRTVVVLLLLMALFAFSGCGTNTTLDPDTPNNMDVTDNVDDDELDTDRLPDGDDNGNGNKTEDDVEDILENTTGTALK